MTAGGGNQSINTEEHTLNQYERFVAEKSLEENVTPNVVMWLKYKEAGAYHHPQPPHILHAGPHAARSPLFWQK